MLKKIASTAAAVLVASAFVATAASAHVQSGTYTLNTVGAQRLTVKQSTTLACLATMQLEVNADGHTGQITSGDLSAGATLCNNVNLVGFNWPVTIGTVSGGSAPITVGNVGASTLLGTCSGGTLSGTINSSGVITITSSSGWTSVPSFYTCSVTGALTSSPVPTLTAP
jgi:hypothetical protein